MTDNAHSKTPATCSRAVRRILGDYGFGMDRVAFRVTSRHARDVDGAYPIVSVNPGEIELDDVRDALIAEGFELFELGYSGSARSYQTTDTRHATILASLEKPPATTGERNQGKGGESQEAAD